MNSDNLLKGTGYFFAGIAVASVLCCAVLIGMAGSGAFIPMTLVQGEHDGHLPYLYETGEETSPYDMLTGGGSENTDGTLSLDPLDCSAEYPETGLRQISFSARLGNLSTSELSVESIRYSLYAGGKYLKTAKTSDVIPGLDTLAPQSSNTYIGSFLLDLSDPDMSVLSGGTNYKILLTVYYRTPEGSSGSVYVIIAPDYNYYD